MINANNFSLLVVVALLASLALESSSWLRQRPQAGKMALRLTWLSLGLLLINLVWLGVERLHIPPTGPDEIEMVLSALILVIYLKIKLDLREPVGFFSIGLLLATVVFAMGVYSSWRGKMYIGQEPLWLWGLLARWSILAGIAGLHWLTLLSALSWWGDITKRPQRQRRLLFEAEDVFSLNRQLQSVTLLMMLGGSILFTFRSWWGWGSRINQGLAVIVVLLLMLGAAWLRFTWPQRRWWMWSLTLLAFLAAWPTLAAIAL